MTPKVLVFSVLVFSLAGVGLMLLVQKSSESERERCSEFCKAKGYGSINAPTGTAGRLVDGSSIPTDVQSYCRCISGDVKGVVP